MGWSTLMHVIKIAKKKKKIWVYKLMNAFVCFALFSLMLMSVTRYLLVL